MSKIYIRKYQKEIEDLYYFLSEYPELRHHLKPDQRERVEERRLQLLDWLWRQMGHKQTDDDPAPHRTEPAEVVGHPPKGTPEGRRMILHLYEVWRANETGTNPGERAKALLMKEFGFKTKEALDKYLQRARRKLRANNQKTVARKFSEADIPF